MGIYRNNPNEFVNTKKWKAETTYKNFSYYKKRIL